MQLQVFLLRNKSSSTQGYTLIELLVVIIIVGILSAIAIPSFLGQTAKARQSEGKMNVSGILRAQQAYFLENNEFVTSIEELGRLGLGIKPQTANYNYLLNKTESGQGVVTIANPVNNAPYKAYAGGVGLVYQAGADNPVSQSILCESIESGVALTASAVIVQPGAPQAGGGQLVCNEAQTQEVN